MPNATPTVQVQLLPPAKPWWHSRTIWANALVLALAAAEAKLQLLQPLLPMNVYAAVAFGLPVLNVVLRVVTTAAVSLGVVRPIDVPGAAR